MANVDAPNGAKPVRHLTGVVIRAREWKIASGSSTSIFTGDFVKLLGTGYIDIAAAGIDFLVFLLDVNTLRQMVHRNSQNIGLLVLLLWVLLM